MTKHLIKKWCMKSELIIISSSELFPDIDTPLLISTSDLSCIIIPEYDPLLT